MLGTINSQQRQPQCLWREAGCYVAVMSPAVIGYRLILVVVAQDNIDHAFPCQAVVAGASPFTNTPSLFIRSYAHGWVSFLTKSSQDLQGFVIQLPAGICTRQARSFLPVKLLVTAALAKLFFLFNFIATPENIIKQSAHFDHRAAQEGCLYFAETILLDHFIDNTAVFF